MSLFGDGRSDDRRRRVLTEDVLGGARGATKNANDGGARTSDDGSPRNRYGEAARMERQTRIGDLIPKSYGITALWFFFGVALIAGVEALHFYMPVLAAHRADGHIPSFSLAGEGNLGNWLSSFLLTLAAGAALVVYSVRKHRADDYHARYRIWFVAAIAWFLLGIDEAAGLHEDFQVLMTFLAGEAGFGGGALYWIGGYAILLGIIGLQLVLDMKECRTSTFFFLLTTGCYMAAVLAHLGMLLPPEIEVDRIMVEEGLELVGNLVLLTSMSLHARFVILEAEGEITPRAAKMKKTKSKTKVAAVEEEQETGDEKPKRSLFGWFRGKKIDGPHKVPAPAGRTSDLEPVSKSERSVGSTYRATTETYESSNSLRAGVKKVQAGFSQADDEDERRDNRKLSKAERKAMRKQKDLERRYDDDE